MEHINTKLQRYLLLRPISAILLPAIFLSLSVSFGLHQIYKQYLFTQKEIVGSQVVHHLFHGLTYLQNIRGLSHIISQVDTSNLNAQQQYLMKEFKNHFNAPQWKKLSHELVIEKEVASIILEVNHLYETKNNTLSKSEIFESSTAIIEKINSVILMVADRSNLILDPELDTYYMMEIAVKQIPDLCEAIAIIRGLGSGMIAYGKTTTKEREFLEEKISIMQNQLKKFERIKSIIRKATATSKTELSFNDNESKLNQILASFFQTCKSLQEDKCNLSAEDFFQLGSEAIAISAETFNINIDMLERRLSQRLTNQLLLMFSTLMVTVLTLAIIFYFSQSFYRIQQNSNRELERISITDPLTSIPNRRYLGIIFDNEIQRAHREGKGAAFGLLDIDFFKRFNDTYGHHEGDLSLQKVVGALRSSLQRAGDFYFRFGGEEFCFFCSAKSLQEAKINGERIRAAVEQLKIEHCENTASHVLTISLGVAFLPKATTEYLDYMIKQADALLYEAKDKGRNKCITVALTT